VVRVIHIQTNRQEGELISLILFFLNKKSRLKIKMNKEPLSTARIVDFNDFVLFGFAIE
jgi:hypothetical protein